jgi:hypothetical protein
MAAHKSIGELVAMGVIAGLVAFGLAYSAGPHRAARAPARSATVLQTRVASFELHAASGRITARARDGSMSRDVDLAIVVDGVSHPLAIARTDLRPAADALRAVVPVPLEDATVEATLELRADVLRDALMIALGAPASGAPPGHTIALRAELSSEGQVVFVPGVGQLADRATVAGQSVVIDADPHPLGIASRDGPVTVEALIDDPTMPADLMRASAESPSRPLGDDRPASLRIAVGQSSEAIWRVLADLTGQATAPVRGRSYR